MAFLRFTLWISLLFHDYNFLGAESFHGQQIALQTLDNFRSLKELQLDESFQLESVNKLIVKRNTDELPSPQIFKFELDDAKEPDAETKKLIQMRARELQLQVQNVEVVNITVSKRSKRAAHKVKPQLIPFLITDAKEPDEATKELIRRSRAKELSLSKNKEPSRQGGRHKETSEPLTQKKEPSRQSRGKTFASIASNKEPLRQGRVKSVALPVENKDNLRQGKVQSVPLPTADQESLRVNRGTSISTPSKHRSSKKPKRKRTRRFAQLTEPRYIKFELHDAKEADNNKNAQVQILPQPRFGARISNHMSDPNTSPPQHESDSSGQDTKYRYFIQQAPRKLIYGPYPKRFEQNDLVFRVSKMQKYIASGQGLENINTNIEITIPPAVTATAILSGYPKQVYGQKICPYGNEGCQVGPVATSQEEFQKPTQNLEAENEVIPEQHQQRYYYNFYTQQQPELHQQHFVPIPKPHQAVAQVVQIPVAAHPPPPQQEPQQVVQNQIDDSKVAHQNNFVKVAYLEPTYGYGNKIYPNTFTHNVPVKPVNEQSANGPFYEPKNQEELQSKNYEHEANQLKLLKNNKEFQELSALIGKSPMDQVHGLSYLLAKEMQRQRQSPQAQRPQDQTSPILFHPKENINGGGGASLQPVQAQNVGDQKVDTNQIVPFRPLRQLYKDAPLNTVAPHPAQQGVQKQASSEISLRDGKAIGLSPNYNGIDSHNYSTQTIYPEAEKDSTMEYASKYSFGYRVRDLHSGNDFAHKQNRDHDGVTRGQYHILMPDGRVQNVVYYADDTGYHADIL